MSHPAATDFEALGLRDSSPFAILKRPRATPDAATPPAKRGPKPNKPKTQQAAMALETMAERKERHAAERQKLKDSILRKNSYSDVARATTADPTNRIVGRRNAARSQ